MLNNIFAQLGLVAVAAISAFGGIYAAVLSRPKVDAEAGKSRAETEQTSDATWISRLDALAKDFDRLQDLSDERFERLVEMEMLITEHVSWDHQVIRVLREHGIDIADPPSLMYVRQKLREAKDRELKGNGPDPTAAN